MDERRKNKRIDVSFPVECKMLPERNYFYTVSKNLSCGGAKIIINDFMPRGNTVKVNINLINRMVNLKAKVAWCNKERISERYTAGLEFVEVNKKDESVLSRFLNIVYH